LGATEGDPRELASLSKEMTFPAGKAQERGLLLLVEAALGRIQTKRQPLANAFHCGPGHQRQIRLTAVPWSRYCITCQELIVEQG